MSGRAGNGILCPLERKGYVDEGGYSLHATVMLCMVEEVALTALVGRMPLENVELRIARHTGRRSFGCGPWTGEWAASGWVGWITVWKACKEGHDMRPTAQNSTVSLHATL